MLRIKIAILLTVLITPFTLMAVEPESKEEQCAQYGSYQDADDTWQVCESDDNEDEDEDEDEDGT